MFIVLLRQCIPHDMLTHIYIVLTAIDEKARVVELNSKLHELCRELRKENALLLDTSKAISAQELSQRKSLTENFQETVEGITRRCVSSLTTCVGLDPVRA